jgi:hypothetical protein
MHVHAMQTGALDEVLPPPYTVFPKLALELVVAVTVPQEVQKHANPPPPPGSFRYSPVESSKLMGLFPE